jgi:hypothetical protein
MSLETRSIFAYGSTLSPRTRRADSVEDLFALVDDLPATLRALGHQRLAPLAAHLIPPVTLAHDGGKLSLMTWAQAERELAARHDLYLAGRLSKKIDVLHGDPAPLVEAAVATVVEVSALDLPRRVSIEEAVLRCLAVSYRAEVRPEPPDKPRRLLEAFADFYWDRFAPRVEAHARERGILSHQGQLIDERPGAMRVCDRYRLERLLARSRRRALLRWPQQLFVFRGSLGYVVAKLRRSWATIS